MNRGIGGERKLCFPAWNGWKALRTMVAREVDSTSKAIRLEIFCLVLLAIVVMQLTAGATGSVTLVWNASTDPLVAGYNVYYGSASATYTNKTNVGTVTNVTISGLVQGLAYYFAVSAYDAMGLESALSSEVSYSLPSQVLLFIQAIPSPGPTISVFVTATGPVPNPWILQSSSDLKNWTPVLQGTNTPVNFLVSINGISLRFFRLTGQ